MLKTVLPAASFLLVTACAFVETTSESEKVRIVPGDRVVGCTQVGTITTGTKAEIAGLTRTEEKIIREVNALAQLEAVNLGADTLAPQGPPKEGRRSYLAYRCLAQ